MGAAFVFSEITQIEVLFRYNTFPKGALLGEACPKKGEAMRKTRVTAWRSLRVTVAPTVLEALEAEAEERAVPVSIVVREILDRAVKPATSLRPF
jgi:hypothetical protein